MDKTLLEQCHQLCDSSHSDADFIRLVHSAFRREWARLSGDPVGRMEFLTYYGTQLECPRSFLMAFVMLEKPILSSRYW